MRHALLLILTACAGTSADTSADKKPEGEGPSTSEVTPADDSPQAETPATGVSCAVRAERLGERLSKLAELGSPVLRSPDVELVDVAGAAIARERGLIVEVDRRGAARLGGKSAPDLTAALQERYERATTFHAERPVPVYIIADARTPARHLRDAAAATRAIGQEARYVVAPLPPVAESYDEELRRVPSVKAFMDRKPAPGGDEATYLAEQIQKALAPCAPIVELFGEVASIEASARDRHLADGMPEALVECECALADVDLFEYATLEMFGSFKARAQWVPMPPLAREDEQTIGEVLAR